MKRVVILSIICFALVFQSVSYAQPYKSSKFPPEKLLYQAFARVGCRGLIIGKFKVSDNNYQIWLEYQKGKASRTILIKLDTNIWIVDGKAIVQK